ncbi:MAG TPA: hypothetical protein VHW24_26130 [Bryobacteraceae bacterium]|jgi:hypothetical protein|nr:hypothetical protein [Bryobacteraceae bacterium]
MDAIEFLIAELDSGEFLLTKGAEMLTGSDFYRRLPNAGESADWLFGHVSVNEDWFLSILTGSAIQAPWDLRDTYQADFPPTGIAQRILPRGELMSFFKEQRRRVKDALRSEDTSKWSQAAPPGLPGVFPTRGAAWGIVGTHQYWHIGQLMTIRTMLGKPAFQFDDSPPAAGAPPRGVSLTVPADGPRVAPRRPEQVSAEVRAEFDKAMETWGIHNHLVRTMGAHPSLALTEVDYANSFIFQTENYAEIPKPGAESPGASVLFPKAGFIDRITKELVITLVSLLNRSRYSITHHGVIAYGTLSALVEGLTPEQKQKRAEALLLGLANGEGQATYRNRQYDGAPLYSPLQLACLELAENMNFNPHLVSDSQIAALRALLKEDAIRRIRMGPLAPQFGAAGPDEAYVDSFIDGMLVELTWCIAHFSGLLNRWFTVLKVRDEDFAINPSGQDFVQVYNAVLPDSIKARNNALLGKSGWGC